MEQLRTNDAIDVRDLDNKTLGENIQFIVIRLGNEQYGIDIKYIDNIVRMQHITRVPKVKKYLKGVINLRGEVIPVMSLRLRMGLDEDVLGRTTRIIILKQEQEGNVGIIVDEVKEVVTLNTNDIEKVSHGNNEDSTFFINGVGKQPNGELISLLDLATITLEDNY
ncbi:MAG: chemotaxis protein CheW [Lachnospiraceae bacterium]|nr:chemotaxis protein CheW [Lachnospiraceae bacterium]